MKLEKRGRGSLDVSYIAYFPQYQKAVLHDLISEINRDHDQNLISEFASVFEKNKSFNYNDNLIKADQIIEKGDLLVNGGIDRTIDAMRGTVSPWRYVATGIVGSAFTPAVSDTVLLNEATGRIDMNDVNRGWHEQFGMKIFYGGIHSEMTGNNIIDEVGIFSASSGGTMLNHTSFGTAQIARLQNPQATMYRQIMIFAVFVEFCPALP
jgi:hypothetical protein